MAKVLVNEEYLTNIAEAIRSKAGTTRTYRPADMPIAISGLNVTEGHFADEVTALAVSMNALIPCDAEEEYY